MSDPQPSTGGRVRLHADDVVLVEEIFADALSHDRAARPSLIAERCGPRLDLRLEIEALLAAHDRLDSFLQPADPDRPLDVRTSPAWAGTLVGQYRLGERIGEGGMGDVYLAERADGLFAHRVAVKLTRASVRDTEGARRFRAERQILASLQHPNIVTLIDGGATPDDQAYLVMEHVDGVSITRYVRERALALEHRLALLSQVCRAVQYAHQRGIVHRDLKPGNILVTSDGVPKVLDFGVAKLLETSGIEGSTVTGLFPGPLTPNYASPEQVRGLPVTTACDVYALGVLAYEVITGVRPYDTAGKSLEDVIDIVVRTDPPRPSAAAGAGPSSGPERRRLKGDLDAIVVKAMAKEPERRYGSAGELADDLERFLAGKPVVAREPSAAYILRRLATRNKVAVGVGAASLVIILGALGAALWQRQAAVRAQGRAEQRFKEVRQLANTLIFKIHDAVAPLAGSTPVRQTIVNEALAYLERLEREAGRDESLRLELAGAYQQIGGILGDPGRANLGDRSGALAQYERARNLVRPLADHPEASSAAVASLVRVNNLLAVLLFHRNEKERAMAVAREGVAYAERQLLRPVVDTQARDLVAKATFTLAMVQPEYTNAVPHWRRAGELFEAELMDRPDDPGRQRNVALVAKYLGNALYGLNDFEGGLIQYRRALAIDQKRFDANPTNRIVQFDYAIDLANVAASLEQLRDSSGAREMYVRSLEVRQKLADSDPKDMLSRGRVGYLHIRLATLERLSGRLESAAIHAREAVRIEEAVFSVTKDAASRRELAAALHELALSEAAGGRAARACGLHRQSLKLFDSSPGLNHFEPTRLDAVAAVKRCDH
jgi:serine/threonine protein kinase/tetratricopeptide (TPR) repeat protein